MKPMLAGKCDDVTKLNYPVMVSPKLDGIRALVVDNVVVSRKHIAIPNLHIQKLFGRKNLNGLDGELMVGAATNGFISGTEGIMRVEGKPDVTFHVFDNFNRPNDWYFNRYSSICHWNGAKQVEIVEHKMVHNAEQLTALEEEYLLAGYEGLMVRDPNGPYKQGRSTAREGWLLKLKRFEDSEALIVGYEELDHNTNEAGKDAFGRTKRSGHKAGKVAGGVLGAFQVKDVHTVVTFNIGSGFNAAQREEFWGIRELLLHKVVKYRYFPTGGKNKPRFPTFLGFRDTRDMS